MTRSLLVLIALVVAAGGCHDDVDLTGMYEVTSNVASSPCGNDVAVTGGPAFLKFHKDDFLGTSYFAYDECMDALGTTCSSAGGLFGGLPEPLADGWRGRASSSSHSGTNCVLSYDETTARLNGSHLVVEHTLYSDAVDLPEAQCTTDEAEKRGTKMGCADHARIEASKR